jgi:uncharacterized protein with GYD domain
MAVFLRPGAAGLNDRLQVPTLPGRKPAMATFISLVNFTDQGIKTVKDSPDRFHAFKAMAEKAGIAVKSVHWTIGRYDLVTVVEGSDEAYTALLLKLGSLGNVRTETLRGFSIDEFKKILSKMP